MQHTDLPAPDAIAVAHSQRLRAAIIDHINTAGGAISFAEYMNHALYEPGLGYYMAGSAKFGAEGDFVTAPEVSPLFGRAIAVQIEEILGDVGGSILELGAGSGKLALSIMQALLSEASSSSPDTSRKDTSQAGALPPGFVYAILEPSAELAQRQRALLQGSLSAEAFERVRWLDKLPSTFDGVVLANEVMDALPVERFQTASDGLRQLHVLADFTLEPQPAAQSLINALAALEDDLGYPLPTAYESEVSLLLAPWIRSLATMLDKGVILLIDYGYPRREYYSLERSRGTLTCFYRHRAHYDPMQMPGLQDITAHVDFTAVAEASVAADLSLLGYASQSAFLLDNNLLDLADTTLAGSDNEMHRMALAKEIKTLTLPGEMGERFQVMALGKRYDRPLRGFRSQDLAYRL